MRPAQKAPENANLYGDPCMGKSRASMRPAQKAPENGDKPGDLYEFIAKLQ